MVKRLIFHKLPAKRHLKVEKSVHKKRESQRCERVTLWNDGEVLTPSPLLGLSDQPFPTTSVPLLHTYSTFAAVVSMTIHHLLKNVIVPLKKTSKKLSHNLNFETGLQLFAES